MIRKTLYLFQSKYFLNDSRRIQEICLIKKGTKTSKLIIKGSDRFFDVLSNCCKNQLIELIEEQQTGDWRWNKREVRII